MLLLCTVFSAPYNKHLPTPLHVANLEFRYFVSAICTALWICATNLPLTLTLHYLIASQKQSCSSMTRTCFCKGTKMIIPEVRVQESWSLTLLVSSKGYWNRQAQYDTASFKSWHDFSSTHVSSWNVVKQEKAIILLDESEAHSVHFQ